ncbi:MAG: tripartite tricarboxylate transporter substrate binding protein [Alphaproteobacteria bacterium]|nr:tripartite tricarboxylate transporter substrate binding protein [Alphaproteobacteria bacterium]
MFQRCLPFVLALAVAGIAGSAVAQSYPTRTVKLLVPFPPGGSNDVAGRLLAAALTDTWGQTVIVENRAGAGGVVGTEVASKAAPDGYTLLLVSSAYPVSPALYKLNYDQSKAFVPVGRFAAGPGVLSVNPKVPAKNVPELLALDKASPGTLNFASAGVGSFEHLAEALFKLQTHSNLVIVQYKGGGPALSDLLGGQIQAQIGSLIQTTTHIQSGELRALAVTGSKRISALPNVPTVAESGVPGFEAVNWWGVVAITGTPQPIVTKVHDDINAVATTPSMRQKLESIGAEPAPMTNAEFGDFIAKETVRWAQVVKEAHISLE